MADLSRIVVTFLCATAGMAAATAQQAGPPAPPVRAEQLLDAARDVYGVALPKNTCSQTPPPGSEGDIVVCGADTEDGRLPEDLRKLIKEEEKRTADGLPRAPDPHRTMGSAVQPGLMNVSRLPEKWVPVGGDFGRPPDVDPALEQMKRAMAAVAAEEAAAQAAAEGGANAPPP